MNSAIKKTEQPPSTQRRKVVFGGSLFYSRKTYSVLMSALLVVSTGSEQSYSQSPESAPSAFVGKCGIREEASAIVFGNGTIELIMDKATGFFRDISNKVTGRHYKLENDGCWPFGLALGYPNIPELLKVEITANANFPQKMTYKRTPVAGGNVLKIKYDNLLSTGGAVTGVELDIDITLYDNADYFLIKAHLKNSGKYSVNNFYSGTGALVAADTREQETLVVPGWDYGKIWSNPHQFFERRETFGYPIFASNCALLAGWIDLMGPDGGIGMGYLNRQGLTMVFNVQKAGQGLNINWQLFNLLYDDPWGHVGGIFPLQPGQIFDTDHWILACHAGDWHRMADIYRNEYDKAFQGTFLNEKNYPPLAKKIDFVSSMFINNEREPSQTVRKFHDVVDVVKQHSEKLDAKPENMLMTLLGQGEHWPYDMPDFLPCNTEAGGNQQCKKMMDELAQMGMGSVLLYAHPFYNSPRAHDYVAEADSGYDHLNNAWPRIGNIACLGSPEWLSLWREKYIPGFAELGAAGVYWDQGPVQYLVSCNRLDHPHGCDAVKQLGCHTKGILELQQSFRDIYERKGRKPIFWVEVGSDLTGRTMDIWTTTEGSYARGGSQKKEIGRYAIPYHLCVDINPQGTAEGVNSSLINGFILWYATEGSKEVMLAQRQFGRIRRELRNLEAPGFPYGFRDTVGLKTSDANLVARSYRNDQGISVLYFAREPLQGTIIVDASALGFPKKGLKTIAVNLKKNEAGYEIISP